MSEESKSGSLTEKVPETKKYKLNPNSTIKVTPLAPPQAGTGGSKTESGFQYTRNTSEKDDDRPEYIETKYGIADQDLKKLGFLLAVEEVGNPYEKYHIFLEEHQDQLDLILNTSKAIAVTEKEEYLSLIEQATVKVKELKDELYEYKEEVSDQVKAKEDLKQKRQEIKERIYLLYNELAEQKKNFISNRIDDVYADFKKLMDGQSALYNDRDGYLSQYASLGKDVSDYTLGKVRKLIEVNERRFDNIQRIINRLDKYAVGPLSYSFLLYVSYLAALVAGSFFKTIICKTNPAPNNVINDIIEGMFIFINSDSRWKTIGLIILWIFFVTIVSLFIDYQRRRYNRGLAERKLDNKSVDGEYADSSFGFSSSEKFGLNISIRSNSWINFWVQIVPFILLSVSVAFILSYKYDKGKVPVYELGSTAAGFVIALILGGLIYLLVARHFKAEDDNNAESDKDNTSQRGITLLIGFLLFWSVVLFMLYVSSSAGMIHLSDELLQFISLGEYLVTTALAAFCLGYGLYWCSLRYLAEDLESTIHWLSYRYKVQYMQVPTLYYANILGDTYDNLHRQLITLLGKRINPFFPLEEKEKALINDIKKESLSVINWLKSKIKSKEIKSGASTGEVIPTVVNWQIMDDDQKLFPEFSTKIDALNKELEDINNQISSLDFEIKGFKNKDSGRYKNAQDKIDRMTAYINGWRLNIIGNDRKLLSEMKHLRRQSIKERVILMDGFHLGMWHRENDMGPVDDFYIKAKKQIYG